jgi:RecA/RadA recombinase
MTPGQELLGALILKPSLLDAVDLADSDFPAGHEREAFASITRIHEEVRDGQPIDTALLATSLGGNGAGSFISGLVSGNYAGTPDSFRARVRIYRQKLVEDRIRLRALEPRPDLQALHEDLHRREALEADNGGGVGDRLVSTIAARVQTRRLMPLWPGVLFLGLQNAIEGDPGAGKSLVLADSVARTTRGSAFPDYLHVDGFSPVRGDVLYITTEGVPDRILVPRLMAAGADLEAVEIITGVYGKDGAGILDVNTHCPALAARIKANPAIKLIVVDPIASHLDPKLNMNSSLEMRQAFDKINALAEETSVAVVTVMHLNKSDKMSAVHRAAGSAQIMAAVKSAWAVVRKPDDENENRRFFGAVKSNISPYRKSLSFEIEETTVRLHDGSDALVPRIVWNGPEEFDLQGALSPGAFELKSKVSAAVTFLRERLAQGPRMARELYGAAEALGINKDRLWEAKRKEGIEDGRETFGGPSQWYYPNQRGREET